LQRSYFDDLPQVTAAMGHRSRNFDHFCLAPTRDQRDKLQWRFERYPFLEALRESPPEGTTSSANASQQNLRSSLMDRESPRHVQPRCVVIGNEEEPAQGCTPAAVGEGATVEGEGGVAEGGATVVFGEGSLLSAEAGRAWSKPSSKASSLQVTPVSSRRGTAIGPRASLRWPREEGGEHEGAPSPVEGASSTSPRGSRQSISPGRWSRKSSAVARAVPGGLPHFEHWCTLKFGSPVRLWRCLDTHNNMKVGQGQFLRGLQDLGYAGDARELFRVLNRDQTGTLLFYHFYPLAALRVAELLHWARANHGGLQGIGLTSVIDQNSRITRSQFKRLFKKKGFENDEAIDFAFELVDKDGNGSANRSEVMVLDGWEFPDWLTVGPDQEAADSLKAQLVEKCQGSALRAWRLLDRSGSMRVSWHEFRQQLRKMVPGDPCERLPAIWRALDDDLSGWLSLSEFDQEAYDCLARFWQWAMHTFGSVVAAFPKLQANDGDISYYEFRAGCKASGLGEAAVHMIFQGLDLDGTGTISMNEVRFLDTWKAASSIKEEQSWSKVRKLHRASSSDVVIEDKARKFSRMRSSESTLDEQSGTPNDRKAAA